MNAPTFTTIIPGLPIIEGQCTVKVDQLGNTQTNRLRAIQHADINALNAKYLERFTSEDKAHN